MAFRVGRAGLLPGLLGLSLLPVLGLAWVLHRESTAHRDHADRMLADCAALAAEDYVRRLTIALDIAVLRPLYRVAATAEAGALPDFDPVADGERRLVRGLARARFRYDTASGSLAVEPMSEAPIDRVWLEAELARYVRERGEDAAYTALVSASYGDEPLLLGCAVTRDNALAGFVGSWTDFTEGFAGALEMGAPILAPLAARGGDVDVVSFNVRTAEGRVLFESAPPVPEALVHRTPLMARHGALTVEAHLDRSGAAQLLLGGMPRSRGVEIALLVVAVAIPLLACLLLLRRERELIRLRADFVANVSHELRTPLAQIRMFAETLRLGRVRDPEEAAASLALLDREARRLEHLVESVLQFGRTDRDAQPLRLVGADVALVARATAAEFAPLAEARRARLDTDRCASAWATMEPAALRVMLLNLLDNAVKYGPEGQTIAIASRAEAGAVVLTVDDEGPGVAVADRHSVWRRGWRGPHDAIAGAGLGLALVRALAARQGGRTAVDAAPGGGARFSIWLVAAPEAP
ncbi:MAG: HAMP domain-containing sensor histidine kinase [Planctomycetota bacterium]